MTLFELIFVSIGLSIDGFVISAAYGTCVIKDKLSASLKISIIFGLFHILMPYLGYTVGSEIKHIVEAFDHWVAFGILALIGSKMIYDDLKKDNEDKKPFFSTNILILLYLALATSIDAFAVGISISLINNTIEKIALIIGIIAFLFSFFGSWFGAFITQKVNIKMQLIGGIILISIGIKVLFEHL